MMEGCRGKGIEAEEWNSGKMENVSCKMQSEERGQRIKVKVERKKVIKDTSKNKLDK